MQSNDALLLFVKNPEKGKVKTRLAKTMGDDMALKIYLALLGHTRNIALEIPSHRFLFYSSFVDQRDDWSNEAFKKRLQHPGDLGTRMSEAFREVLEHHSKAVIIGSDCASLTTEIVQSAFDQLDQHDFVIGPAKDGGYYLLGMKTHSPTLFQDIAWSTEEVFPSTVKKINALNGSYFLLPELSDIDYEEDWKQYGWELD